MSELALAHDKVWISHRIVAYSNSCIWWPFWKRLISSNRWKQNSEKKRGKARSLSTTPINTTEVESIHFDRRKHLTLTIQYSNSKRRRVELTEKHCTTLSDLGSNYLGHVHRHDRKE